MGRTYEWWSVCVFSCTSTYNMFAGEGEFDPTSLTNHLTILFYLVRD